MSCKKKIIGVVLATIALNANAGLDWTTVHSRANCLNNESITWWYLHPYMWRVVSVHKLVGWNDSHQIDTGFNYTWRAHAIHWAEPIMGPWKWEVWGYHFLGGFHDKVPFETTHATSCNIIEGW